MGEVTRDGIQINAANLWLQENNRFGTLILGTGVGKSRVAMLILQRLFDEGVLTKKSKILLLVDSEKLRDHNWKEDFSKWDCAWMYDYVTAECYQSFYKRKNEHFDFLIADEIDFAMTSAYVKAFTKNKFNMVLGLTGYVDPEKRELLHEICPILLEYSTDDAQRDGVLNKTQVVFVYYYLSQNSKDITITHSKNGKLKKFTQSENDSYAFIQERFDKTLRKVRSLSESPEVLFNLDQSKIFELKNSERLLKNLVNKRKELLLNNKASVEVAKALISKILDNPKNKVLVFSSLTDHVDNICEVTYHGKNKKENKSALKDLSSGTIRACGVCKAVNRGVNLVGVNNLIMESFDGSKTAFRQRHGRGTRLLPDQLMYMYVMIPLFIDKVEVVDSPNTYAPKVRPTQAKKWATEMMSGYMYTTKPITITKGLGEDEWF